MGGDDYILLAKVNTNRKMDENHFGFGTARQIDIFSVNVNEFSSSYISIQNSGKDLSSLKNLFDLV
jgi:hypothetical protein